MQAGSLPSTIASLTLSAGIPLLFGGWEGTDGGPSTPSPWEMAALIDAFQSEITMETMGQGLDPIVQYDRLPGSPGEAAAVDHLIRTMQTEGIQARVDTFLAYVRGPVSASVEVPGTGFAPDEARAKAQQPLEELRS